MAIRVRRPARTRARDLRKCTLPLTSARRVNLIVTELAVIEPSEAGLVLKERAPGVSVDKIVAATEATLIIPADVSEMPIW